TLSISETNAMHVEQVTALWPASMLQHETTPTRFLDHDYDSLLS
ncbi:hypothetical protein Tco_1289179, partial [Tanacetum coccineum]